MLRIPVFCLVGLIHLCCSNQVAFSQNVFNGGQTGAWDEQIKAVCPAFIAGEFKLSSTTANQNNIISSDVFEHESGARCACTRNKSDKTLKCGPIAPRRSSLQVQ